jgi:hypothetical protein
MLGYNSPLFRNHPKEEVVEAAEQMLKGSAK